MPEDASFLDRLAGPDRAALRAAGRARTVPARTVLFREGEPGYEVQWIESGALKLTRTALDGREVVLAVRAAGDLVGELSAIDGRPRSATGTALSEIRMLAVPCTEFRGLLEERPTIGRALLEVLCSRLRDSGDQVLEFGTDDALARVCRRIAEFADAGATPGTAGPVVELPMSQRELAEWSGLSREAVVKALRTLRTLGWIETEGRRVTLLDGEALRRRAGGPHA